VRKSIYSLNLYLFIAPLRYALIIGLFITSVNTFGQSWDSLNANGLKFYAAGKYTEAENYFKQALLEAKKNQGSKDKTYSATLSNLAFVYKTTGDYANAARLFRAVILHSETFKKKPDLDAIEARVNLANLFLDKGQYDSCEFILKNALEILTLTRVQTPDTKSEEAHSLNMNYVSIQNSLASLKKRLGQVSEGTAIMEQVLVYIRQTYPNQFDSLSEYRAALTNLVNYYIELGSLDDAKKLAIEHDSLVQKFEPNSMAHLYSLQNIANIYRLLSNPDSAILKWNSALRYIQEGHFQGSELQISMLSNLGELYGALEKYDHAIAHLVKAKELAEKRGGINPRLYQTILFNLAESYHWSSHYPEAYEIYQQLTTHLMRDVLYNFTYLSETEKIAFYRNQRSILESYLFFALSVSGKVPLQKTDKPYINDAITGQLYDLQIMTKGIILNASHKMKQRILEGNDEALKSEYRQWEQLKSTLASELKNEATSPERIPNLERDIEQLEIQLSRKSANFKRGFMMKMASWKDIQKKLKPGEAAIEMVRFFDGLIYGALVITAETKNQPVLAILKSKENRYLEKEYYKQYLNAIEFKITDSISYDVYWRPIITAIKQQLPKGQVPTRIYYSPDGIYNQINLNTLFDTEEGKYLIDQVELLQLTNTKELIEGTQHEFKNLKHAILVGRPSYSLNENNSKNQFVDLQGTEAEVDKIGALLKQKKVHTTVYKGVDASEHAVKQLQHHTILHLATHGFFDQHNEETNVTNALVQTLLNSGVVLAGSNHPETVEHGDGILTAYEALSLNLDATELVVLSACQTGLGEFHPGEGVYGLRLALRAAGAQASIMSLWKVDDDATQELMTTFYRIWLTQKIGMREAFRIAQQQLRKEYPQPYFWGAFVLVGN
jgi:CHAT domain-containing protein